MKSIIKCLLYNKTTARLLLRPILRLHAKCYQLAARYGSLLNDGVHPKHHILKYKEWFRDHVETDWTVLDIGSNTGMMVWELARKAAFVYGVEVNARLVAKAQAKRSAENISYICADAVTHDYGSCRPIHCVTMSNVLEHIEDRIAFLRKLVDRTPWAEPRHKRFLFRVPMLERDWITLYKKEMGVEHRLDSGHFIEYTLETFKNELGEAEIAVKTVDVRFGEIYAVCEGRRREDARRGEH